MKTYQAILLWLIFLLPSVARSQDYQNICSPGITYYSRDGYGWLFAFRSDTVISRGNYDSLFVAFPEVMDTTSYTGSACFDSVHGTVLGNTVYKRHDGRFFFFNRRHDTIAINTQAALYDTWRFCNLDTGSYILAKVTAINTETVFGKADLVKTISLQARDKNGNNIPSVFNQQVFKLSRNYGLTKILDLYSVPFDTVSYTLVGKTKPELGIGDLTMDKVFNFDAGDEFHYKYLELGGDWTETYSIKRILQKTVNPGNTIDYLVNVCSITRSAPHFGDTLKKNDTLIEHYDFNLTQKDSAFYYLPFQFVPHGASADIFVQNAGDIGWGSNRERLHDRNAVNRSKDPACWGNDNTNTYDNLYYCEGLGLVEEDFSAGNLHPGVPGSEYYLIYYIKGSKVWGTPRAVSCQKLLDIGSLDATSGFLIRVTPNPVEYNAEISLHGLSPGYEISLVLLDCLGKPVFNVKYRGMPLTFQRGNIPAGLYLLLAKNHEGACIASRKLVFR